MAASSAEMQDICKLYKYTKELALKVAQIVVQSRQGKKITHQLQELPDNSNIELTPPLQWFDLSIPEEPRVNEETKGVLNGEVIDALSKILCIEISLRTSDGDEMVLEIWTVRLISGIEICSLPTLYYRMSVMLKSTLTISRITPAYKLARSQSKELYKIYHKIYGGEPNYSLLGDKHKTVKVGELHTPIGTLLIEVVYRTKMTMIPEDRHKIAAQTINNDIMPLTAGAFVDVAKIKELHDTLSQKLPPEPPMQWLLAEKEKMEHKLQRLAVTERVSVVKGGGEGSTSAAVSKAIEVPKKNGDKYSGLMDFPFADGSPIAELANFYQECLQARSMSDEWTDLLIETSASTDSETLSRQLKMYEEAVPEFDNMVASMFSNSEGGSDHS
ncbi:Autophagy-related protein 13 [Operophtera brumata]|uniref:Autophagy-related protein 13 n=1 Tax=Operophtera brumata TaxID=104452 RepID=A0A0L7LDJ7_OPEBR|nr:Autophagy-related protein 13 [Operophtera brumata]